MKKVLYILMFALALVGCKKQPYLEVDKPSLSLSSAGGTEQITVSANYAWTASASDSWIKVKYTEGENVLKVTVSANNNTDGRQGSISVRSESLTVTIPVTQNQRDAIELESSGRVSVGAEAQQLEIKLRSNVDVSATVTEGADWVSVVSTKAMTPHSVTLAVKANDGRTMRRALVAFTDKTGAVSQQIMLDQDGRPQVVTVTFRDVDSFQVPMLEGLAGAVLSGTVFWDMETQGTTYDGSLSKIYNGAPGSLRIEARNAGTISFADVNGLVSIDLSEF